MVLDGYLMTHMGLKDLIGDRAKRLQEKKTNSFAGVCSVNLKVVIGSCFKHLCVCFSLLLVGGGKLHSCNTRFKFRLLWYLSYFFLQSFKCC